MSPRATLELPLSMATVSPRSIRKSGASVAILFRVLVQLESVPSWMLICESVVISKVKVAACCSLRPEGMLVPNVPG